MRRIRQTTPGRLGARYDKLARNFLSAICFAADVAYWLN